MGDLCLPNRSWQWKVFSQPDAAEKPALVCLLDVCLLDVCLLDVCLLCVSARCVSALCVCSCLFSCLLLPALACS